MRAWIFDLDGVVWRGTEAIPEGVRAARTLLDRGEAVLFVTNFSHATLAGQEARLGALGLDAAGRVVNSAAAAASLLEPGERVFVVGGPGVVEAVEARGAVVSSSEHASAVVVGIDPAFDYGKLTAACRAIWRGARFIATNDDRTYPSADGLLPGCGAIVAAVAAATGTAPTVAGKPHGPMAQLIGALLGAPADGGAMFGDRADTDGAFARALGLPFALVLSGVTTAAQAAELRPVPEVIADNALAALDRLTQLAAADDRPEIPRS